MSSSLSVPHCAPCQQYHNLLEISPILRHNRQVFRYFFVSLFQSLNVFILSLVSLSFFHLFRLPSANFPSYHIVFRPPHVSCPPQTSTSTCSFMCLCPVRFLSSTLVAWSCRRTHSNNGIHMAGNKCFKLVHGLGSNRKDWAGALEICRRGPGYLPDLASISSEIENGKH